MRVFFRRKYKLGVMMTTRIRRRTKSTLKRSRILVVARKNRNRRKGSIVCSNR